MDSEVEDNWNQIVLKVATSGGFLMENGSKRILCITELIIEPKTDQLMTIFVKYDVTVAEYKKILKEAQVLRTELHLMDEDIKTQSTKKPKKTAPKKKRTPRTTKSSKK